VSTKAFVPAPGNQSTFMSLVHFIYILSSFFKQFVNDNDEHPFQLPRWTCSICFFNFAHFERNTFKYYRFQRNLLEKKSSQKKSSRKKSSQKKSSQKKSSQKTSSQKKCSQNKPS
jgi:hypothetical protein